MSRFFSFDKKDLPYLVGILIVAVIFSLLPKGVRETIWYVLMALCIGFALLLIVARILVSILTKRLHRMQVYNESEDET